MAVLVLVHLGVIVIAAWLLIENAREAVQEETAASIELARKLAIAVVAASVRHDDPAAALAELPLTLQQPRHVRVTLLNAAGDVLATREHAESDETEEAEKLPPAWFIRLIAPPVELVRIPITVHGTSYGAVAVSSEPYDEIAEVWEDSRDLFVLMVSALVTLLVLVHVLLGRTLKPVATILKGLQALKQDQYGLRLPPILEPDLDRIGSSINALAARLEATTLENNQLGQQLVTLQDSERKAIAHELHDEFGPCLFGIQVDAHHIEASCETLGGETAETIRGRAQAIMDITELMQMHSRAMLRRLCPMTLGEVSLSHLLEDLIEGFRSHHPDIAWTASLPDTPSSFGDTVDLTLYRTVQEGLTNAARHAAAKRVDVSLDVRRRTKENGDDWTVELLLQDDGGGLPKPLSFGLGLTGMSHRVRVLGGRFEIGNRSAGGTAIRVWLPARPVDDTELFETRAVS